MRTALLLALLVACTAEDRRSPPPATQVAPQLANATQAALAGELDAAEKHGTWIEVRRRWQGQKLRWTVTRQRMLCASADACNVAAFPIQRPAQHGWMPELKLSPAQYAKLQAKCGAAEQCDFTFEGTLAKLEVSDEAPTRLRFENIQIL